MINNVCKPKYKSVHADSPLYFSCLTYTLKETPKITPYDYVSYDQLLKNRKPILKVADAKSSETTKANSNKTATRIANKFTSHKDAKKDENKPSIYEQFKDKFFPADEIPTTRELRFGNVMKLDPRDYHPSTRQQMRDRLENMEDKVALIKNKLFGLENKQKTEDTSTNYYSVDFDDNTQNNVDTMNDNKEKSNKPSWFASLKDRISNNNSNKNTGNNSTANDSNNESTAPFDSVATQLKETTMAIREVSDNTQNDVALSTKSVTQDIDTTNVSDSQVFDDAQTTSSISKTKFTEKLRAFLINPSKNQDDKEDSEFTKNVKAFLTSPSSFIKQKRPNLKVAEKVRHALINPFGQEQKEPQSKFAMSARDFLTSPTQFFKQRKASKANSASATAETVASENTENAEETKDIAPSIALNAEIVDNIAETANNNVNESTQEDANENTQADVKDVNSEENATSQQVEFENNSDIENNSNDEVVDTQQADDKDATKVSKKDKIVASTKRAVSRTNEVLHNSSVKLKTIFSELAQKLNASKENNQESQESANSTPTESQTESAKTSRFSKILPKSKSTTNVDNQNPNAVDPKYAIDNSVRKNNANYTGSKRNSRSTIDSDVENDNKSIENTNKQVTTTDIANTNNKTEIKSENESSSKNQNRPIIKTNNKQRTPIKGSIKDNAHYFAVFMKAKCVNARDELKSIEDKDLTDLGGYSKLQYKCKQTSNNVKDKFKRKNDKYDLDHNTKNNDNSVEL